jgi:hypothetical protein
MWPCHTEPSKQPIPYSPITPSNRDRFRAQVFRFSWLSWVFLHDSSGLLVPKIICFSSASAPYLFHICFRKYLFSYLFSVFLFSFLLPHKNMKTNVAALSSVRFCSVFIPSCLRHLLAHLQLVATRNLHTTQPRTLLPTYDEVLNLTGLL